MNNASLQRYVPALVPRTCECYLINAHWRLLAPIQCQQESPLWGVVTKETVLFKQLDCDAAQLGAQHGGGTARWCQGSVMKQHSCETACLPSGPGVRWPWGKTILQLDSSALFHLLGSAPGQRQVSTSWESQPLVQRESVHPKPEGSRLIYTE